MKEDLEEELPLFIEQEFQIRNIKPDFEADAHAYLNEIQMHIDPQNYVPCDASGKFSDECAVIFDDGHYDE